MALSKARRAFNALRILYPAISKRVNTNDSYPAVELAECARCLMDASGNIIVAADNLATLNASTVTLAGAISVADPTTPSVSLATGKTNTGFFLVYGKTSGSTKITTADATGQAVTISTLAQTVGAVTLSVPDFAGVNDTYVFTTLAQTLAGKTLAFVRVSTQALSGAGAVNVTTGTTKLTTTGASQALTLADGVDGQRKSIIHEVDGGSAILTPTTKTGFSTVTFSNVGDSVQLEFVTTRGWMIAALNGAVAA